MWMFGSFLMIELAFNRAYINDKSVLLLEYNQSIKNIEVQLEGESNKGKELTNIRYSIEGYLTDIPKGISSSRA